MTVHSPFDHVPDPALGDALREVLGVTDDPAFVRAVLERTRAPQPWWEVLGDWARPGVAAALLLVAVGSFLLGRLVAPAPTDVAGGDILRAGFEVSSLFVDGTAPNVETLLTDGMTR
jgi:hypothetical protein